ncbi:DNA phosphorothioation system sulfurtransferase DndC [Caenimonas terrae]|uniref:DNA phosphorothioation system sulfurtransferase DndC n=1 Tax=Caenimonas terrae TaxID=696074 RepID=A0ABW0N7N9_9BURK
MPASVEHITREIQDLYMSDSMPWIVGYSGGKDSTASLQLIWNAISSLPSDRRRFKPVHVISTDTLVENPVIAAWVDVSLKSMNLAATRQGLPIQAHRLTPALEHRFWVNLIGKGYPAPRPKFRWCTDRLKISASTAFIQSLSDQCGEAILVLGQRRGESSARDKVMDTYASSTRERLSRNKDPKLSRVWVYLPIETWSSDDVWEYIISNKNPWGVDNQDLFDIYRGATPDSECPIVVDKSTPSCGDSRFGCYVCTMVTQDKSMHAMIQNDKEKAWMQPILHFRNTYLAVDDRDFRDFRRMNGQLILMNDRLVHGPYSQERRRELLEQLLLTQQQVREAGRAQGFGDIELISLEELDAIRSLWVVEKGEIEDWVPEIYTRVMGVPYPGRELEPMPLERTDLGLLRTAATGWVNSAKTSATESEPLSAARVDELYKMTRSLLAVGFRGLQSRRRSEQLNELENVLKAYAFLDEADALQYARQHLVESGDNPDRGQLKENVDEGQVLDALLEGHSAQKVIPIRSIQVLPNAD